jgi:hypothetical protein
LAAIEDLTVTQVTSSRVCLHWTAPGDWLKDEKVQYYLFHASTCPLTEENCADTTAAAVMARSKRFPGERDSVVWAYLKSDTKYYFGVVSVDDAGNHSDMSNVAEAVTPEQKGIEWIGTYHQHSSELIYATGPTDAYLYLHVRVMHGWLYGTKLVAVDVSDYSRPTGTEWPHGVFRPALVAVHEQTAFAIGRPYEVGNDTSLAYLYSVSTLPEQPEIYDSCSFAERDYFYNMVTNGRFV